ncbi:MAG: hypothetical protein ACRELF_27960 [Gemmataceae bacterium]
MRGAVCQGGQRNAAIDEGKVRHLAQAISSATSAS